MVEEKKTPGEIAVPRFYEQAPDAVSFYSDIGQVLYTGNEVVLQFYETIPGPPAESGGGIKNVRSRLRATITISTLHAHNIGKLLLEKIEEGKK
jgi:hypothetical protein